MVKVLLRKTSANRSVPNPKIMVLDFVSFQQVVLVLVAAHEGIVPTGLLMPYTATLEPTILCTEVVMVPVIRMVVFELGLGPIHAVEAHAVKVTFRPLLGLLNNGMIVLPTIDAVTLVRYRVVEIL